VKREIKPRKMDFPFDATIPRHYFFGSAFATHLVNGLNLIFPMGERFFIRSVRHYLDRIEDDPELMAQVKGFIGQEVRHGLEHERFFRILEAQGYDVQTFLRLYQRIAYDFLEPAMPPKVCLSVTVALEHFTATLGERALSSGNLEQAHPLMRELLMWHAAEEIEHKAVAFDVLRKVDDSYLLRILGLLVASSTLVPFWLLATFMLARQERGVPWGRAAVDMVSGLRGGVLGKGELGKAFLQYLRPGFHPDDIDNAELAERYFASRPPAQDAA
jgi:predicted metal-dependent hydrolase